MTSAQQKKTAKKKRRRNNDAIMGAKLRAVPATSMRYYDLSKNWVKRIKRHLGNKELNDILEHDFNYYTLGTSKRWFLRGMLPCQFEGTDWWGAADGRPRAYWRYVKHGPCHWLVNFALCLAYLAEPKRAWRIVMSEKHSTVWDGHRTLFEFNYQAMGIDPQSCWERASERGIALEPRSYINVFSPGGWSRDVG